ncbi:hypothetical protein MMC25_006132 [Agyrium rufum]|nr:hypothetical protein [Agyrium rufum]
MNEPPKNPTFPTRLSASSYNSPLAPNDPSNPYAPLRASIIKTATTMGYDMSTATERGLLWSEDQDPFGHVTNTAYPHFIAICNHRIFESFEQWLGEETYEEMIKGKGIGPVVGRYELELKKVVQYPDSIITANRLTEIRPDRYLGITTVWSLRLQTIVAECKGWIVFADFAKGRPVNLVEQGGVWADLYHGLKDKVEAGNKLAEEWAKAHPKKERRRVEEKAKI